MSDENAATVESATTENEDQVENEESTENLEEQAQEGSQPAKDESVEKDVVPSVPLTELVAERKKKREAREEAVYLKGQLDSLKESLTKTPERQIVAQPVAPAGTPVEPISDKFETWEAYEKAHARWVIDVAKFEMRQEQIAEQRKQVLTVKQQEQQVKRDTFESRIEKAAENDPSILTLLEDDTLPVHKSALDIIYESDVPAELLQALNKDRKEATRIFHLFNSNPIMAAREIGKIESRLQNAPKPEPPKRVSAAPEPIKPIKGSGSGLVDDANLPIDQWITRRNKAQFGR